MDGVRPCDCEVEIDVPQWVPPTIAFGISFFMAIMVFIVYSCREMERHKNFYGKEDKLSTREEKDEEVMKKEEMDAIAYGGCNDEVLLIESPHHISPGSVVKSGVKIMLRKKKIITKTPVPVGSTSQTTVTLEKLPYSLNFQIILDKTGRVFELLDLVNQTSNSLQNQTNYAEHMIEFTKGLLEKMTSHHFVVYGVQNSSQWIVRGQENLLEDVEEMNLQMILQITGALHLRIMAYKVQTVSIGNISNPVTDFEFSKTPERFEVQVEQTQETPCTKLVDKKRSTPEITPLTTPNARTRTSTSVKQRRAAKFQTTKAARHQKKAIEINSKTPASDLKTTGSINKNGTILSVVPPPTQTGRNMGKAKTKQNTSRPTTTPNSQSKIQKSGPVNTKQVSNTTPQKKSTKILSLINETKRNTTATAVPTSLTKDAKSILNAVRLVQPGSRESTMKNQN